MKYDNPCVRALAALAVLLLTACGGDNVFGIGMTGVDVPLTGSIAGTVTADGLPLGGVRIVLVQRDSVETDSRGEYIFTGLAAGTYTVAARVPVGLVLAPGEEPVRAVTVVDRGVARADWRLLQGIGAEP